jgi:hemin uptake protein HemP
MSDSPPAQTTDALAAPERKSFVAGAARIVDSDQLLAGASQLAIRHRDAVYFLRETRFGKLILTK